MIRKVLTVSFVSACLGSFALVAAPAASVAAETQKSSKSAKAKKKPAKKASARAGAPQNKQMRMQANPAGSRFPYSYRY